jgi:hypothetical protein
VKIGLQPKEMDHTSSNDIVQLHQLSHNYKTHVNESLLRSESHPRGKRRKRKQIHDLESDSNAYSFENHSYNHITKAKNDDNHIIKTNRNEKKRRKVKSINLVDSNKFNSSSSSRQEQNKKNNITLWIFKIKQTLQKDNAVDVEDKVK